MYLDHHAATPLCPEAGQVMGEAAAAAWANPSSVHGPGRASRRLLEGARAQVAEAIGAEPADIVFTAGGTEACNLAVAGLGHPGEGIVTTAIEHPAVANAVRRATTQVVSLAMPGGEPPPEAEVLQRLADGPAGLLACQWVNHETGNIVPVADYVRACAGRGVRTFVDATQALGKLPVDVEALGADAVAFASHKIGGPAGAGALWVRRGVELEPLLAGGGQERGRRPGTPDVLSLVGFGAACQALPSRIAAIGDLGRLRDQLEACLSSLGAVVNGTAGPRVPTVVNASFQQLRGDMLVAALDVEGLACASGAACSSGVAEPSAVIAALYPEASWRARGALRLSMGPETTEAEVEAAMEVLRAVVPRMLVAAR